MDYATQRPFFSVRTRRIRSSDPGGRCATTPQLHTDYLTIRPVPEGCHNILYSTMQFPFFYPNLSEKGGRITKPQSQRLQSSEIIGGFNYFLLGIWDLYIEKPSVKWRFPFYSLNVDMGLFVSDLQYLWKAVCDLSSSLLFARLTVSAVLALSPAVSLWCASAVN